MRAALAIFFLSTALLYADDPALKPAEPAQPTKPVAVVQEPVDVTPQTVCLRVTRRIPSAAYPHSAPRVVTEESTGVRLGGQQVVTDLENVRGAVSIQMRVPGNPASAARVLFAGWDAGLALLGPEDQAIQPAAAPALEKNAPALDSELTLSSCGTTSLELHRLRVDRLYDAPLENNDGPALRLVGVSAAASASLRGVQSGAPVFLEKRLAGIYHAGKAAGYVIPARYVARFLLDTADGVYNGIPRRPFEFQTLLQSDLRRYLSVPSGLSGVRITRVFGDSLLLPGDYLKDIDGATVSNDGTILQGTPVSLDEFFASHLAGKVNATVSRGGKDILLSLDCAPLPDSILRARSTADRRTFFYGAGLMFQELDYDLIHDTDAAKDAQLRYRYALRAQDRLSDESDRDVILTNVFPDSINAGAEKFRFGVVESANGATVRNLRDLKAIWLSAATQYIVLKFRGRAGLLVIPRENLKTDEIRIRDKYNLNESGLSEGLP